MAGPPTIPALIAAAVFAQAATPVSDAPLRAEVDRLAAAVSAARHLPFHGPLPARAVGPDAIRGELVPGAATTTSGSGPAAEEPFLRRLGLIPALGDYARRLAEDFVGAPVPRYDPVTKRLLVPDVVPFDELAPLLPHEIAHAIADQRFGLRRMLQIGPDGSHRLGGDAERARLAVIEGDATLSALEAADPRETFLGARELAALAANLRQAAAAASASAPGGALAWNTTLGVFTHVDGLLFVARVRAHQPWRAVDRLWEDPPSSTEQVLHPEKYDACEEPVHVDDHVLPTLPTLGRPTATATLGELVIRTWLASVLPAELAERAAAGWAGDRAGLYAPEPQTTPAAVGADRGESIGRTPPLAWLTVWDDEAEAEDFARAAAAAGRVDRARNPQTGSEPPAIGSFGRSPTDPDAHVARDAEAVALVFGVVDDPPAALSDMLADWRRQKAVSRRAGAHPRRAAPPSCPRRDRAVVSR